LFKKQFNSYSKNGHTFDLVKKFEEVKDNINKQQDK